MSESKEDILNLHPHLYLKDISGSFKKLSVEHAELVMEIVAQYHYRNGVKNNDGSMGTIRISPAELNDCLAFILLKERAK